MPACLDAPALPPAPSGIRSTLPVWVLAAGLDGPDDLVFERGRIYVGELNSGRIALVMPGAALSRLPQTVPKVEGLAWLGDTLFAADQQNDRVDSITVAGPVEAFVQLQPVAGNDNVDGIASDGSLLIVPDAARGVVDWYDSGGRLVKQVGGFVRPAGAWALADGTVFVADEYGNSAVKLGADGTRTVLVQGLPIIDDVAVDPSGHIFVITPVVSGGRLAEVVGGFARDISGNLLQPQGLGFDGAGNILVAEASAGRVDVFIRNFKLVPVASAPQPGQPVCVNIFRAPGFTGNVELAGASGVTVVQQPGTGNQGEVLLGDGCGQAGCALTASSGSLSDSLWITR